MAGTVGDMGMIVKGVNLEGPLPIPTGPSFSLCRMKADEYSFLNTIWTVCGLFAVLSYPSPFLYSQYKNQLLMNNRKTIKCKGCKPLSTKSPSLQKRALSSNKSTLKNLIKRNNYLQEENILLKQNSFYNHPSSILKSSGPQQQHCCLVLQDKLFHANKTLQDTILNLDSESELNKVLELKISEQEIQIKRIQHERNSLLDEIDKYRYKYQKYVAFEKTNSKGKLDSRKMTMEPYHANEHQKYQKLLEAHSALQEKYEVLEECVSSQKLLELANRKMNMIQQNITKIQQNNEQLIETLNGEYDRFKDDTNQYFRCLYHDLRDVVSPGGQIRNFKSTKEETYRNPTFKQISDKYNIPKLIHDILNLITQVFNQEMVGFSRVISPLLGKLQGRIGKLDIKCRQMDRCVQSLPRGKSKPRRYSHQNNQNINTSNRIQHSFY